MLDPEFADKLFGFPVSRGREAVKISLLKFSCLCLAIPVAALMTLRLLEWLH
jgi:hypothetical protein